MLTHTRPYPLLLDFTPLYIHRHGPLVPVIIIVTRAQFPQIVPFGRGFDWPRFLAPNERFSWVHEESTESETIKYYPRAISCFDFPDHRSSLTAERR